MTVSASSPPRDDVQDRALRAPTVSLATVAWVLVVALFILLRVGLVWRAPVGGAELAHLSGAWQASIGVEDARYVPTLYQAIAAFTLEWTESEEPARALALAATLTIPLALLRLRRVLGEGGALLTLLLLALDPVGIVLGVTATAAAWDAAIAIWLVVALVASRPPPWGWLLLAFLAATAGPLTLPVVVTALLLALRRGSRPPTDVLIWGAAGVLLGVLLASLQFGLAADGLRVAPVLLFAAGFEESWSTLNVAELAALYGLPLLVGAAAAGLWLVRNLRVEGRRPSPVERLSLAMAGVALLWFLVALPTASPFPLAAATFFSSILLGPVLARAVGFMFTVEWRSQAYLLPLVFGLAAVAFFVLSGWAAQDSIGGAVQRVLVAIPLFVAVVAASALVLALLSTFREGILLALVPLLAAGGILLLSGASGISLSAAGEPLPGPVSPASARAIREVALDAAASGGSIVVHERYREQLVWPFRASPGVTLARQVPEAATVAIWPVDVPPPPGFGSIEGRWVLGRSILGPDGFLGALHWLAERNSLDHELELVAIYVRMR